MRLTKIAAAAATSVLASAGLLIPVAASAAPASLDELLGTEDGRYGQIGEVDTDAALTMLDGLKETTADPDIDYDRTKDFGQWASQASGKSADDEFCGTTRDDILNRDLDDVTYDAADDCRVETGVLKPDPYTGTDIDFQAGPGTSSAVQIDHMIPLKSSMWMGMATRDFDDRFAFANDPDNLIAVYGPANGSKSDSTPAEWMPGDYVPKDQESQYNEDYSCQYAAHYTWVADKYDLAVTAEDKTVMKGELENCSIPKPEPSQTPKPTPSETEAPPQPTPTQSPTLGPSPSPTPTPSETETPKPEPTETETETETETADPDPSQSPKPQPSEPTETSSSAPTETQSPEPKPEPSDDQPAAKRSVTVSPEAISTQDFLDSGVDIASQGHIPDSAVTIRVSGGGLDPIEFPHRADRDGTAEQNVHAVGRAIAGEYTVTVTDDIGEMTATFTVTDDEAAGTGQADGDLPRTGSTVVPIIIVGALLVALGVTGIYLSRKNKEGSA